jgi:alpha-galactosidase
VYFMLHVIFPILFAIGMLSAQWAWAMGAASDEMAESRRWAASKFEGVDDGKPADAHASMFDGVSFFSFTYQNKPSGELLKAWDCKRASRKLDDNRTEHSITWTDAKTGLVLRCVGVEYNDFPVVEWTLYFKNTSDRDTPILENIQGIDVVAHRNNDGEFVLRGSQGDANMADSYAPFEQVMVHNMRRKFAPDGGRPCDMAFPYFNLASPGGGVVMAVGWPGQWAASFHRDADNGLHLFAGQELTRFSLKPGEEVRSPLIAMLFWKGDDVVRSQNLWRRWMLAHNMPRKLGDKPIRPLLTYCTFASLRWGNNTEALEKLWIDELAKQNALPDYWWMDAGWFEPESTYPWAITAKSNPKGLLKSNPADPSGQVMVNFGNPEARQWMTDCIDKLIKEEGIDVYRQDFNMGPLPFWRNTDEPNRLGITENLHVQGYLAFWDELLRRNPKLWIDSCAGGGRRNDLEAMRRSVPLLRSDYQEFSGNPRWAVGNQGHTYGIASWIPYFGQNMMYNPDQFVYSARSYMCPAYGIQLDVRKNDADWDLYRRVMAQWRQVADCYLGDYYPLTPYSLLSEAWMAWQFNRPEQGDGMIQAFRHDKAAADSISVKLHDLEPDAAYVVTNFDVPGATEATGHELMEKGLTISIKDQPGSAILSYKKKKL